MYSINFHMNRRCQAAATNVATMIRFTVFTLVLGSVCVGKRLDWAEWLPNSSHDDLQVRLFSSDGSSTSRSLGEAMELFDIESYNATLDLVMIILGYEKNQNAMIQETVEALLSRGIHKQYNIMAVDLPQRFAITARNFYYLRPAINVPTAGKALGKFINQAVATRKITHKQVNVISFSLGAQIAGYMARTANRFLNSVIGVDPSGIMFDWSRFFTRLVHISKKDARYVHLYYSNSVMFGSTLRVGHANYVFNNGHIQAGCKKFDLMCSHLRGFAYFIEALRSATEMLAVQCYSYDHLQHCKCDGQRTSYIGFPPDISASGLYFLRTRDEPPYSLGKNGITGVECKSEKTEYVIEMGHRYDELMNMLDRK